MPQREKHRRLAGCATTVRALLELEHDGILLHGPKATRAWFEHGHSRNQRSLPALTREQDITPAPSPASPTNGGIPLRGRTGYNDLNHFNLSRPPSAAILAITAGPGGLDRLRLTVEITNTPASPLPHEPPATEQKMPYDNNSSRSKVEPDSPSSTDAPSPTQRGQASIHEAKQIPPIPIGSRFVRRRRARSRPEPL